MENKIDNTFSEETPSVHEKESLEVLEARIKTLIDRLEIITNPRANIPPEAKKAEIKTTQEEITSISKTIEFKKRKESNI